jgi:hypothetical protein
VKGKLAIACVASLLSGARARKQDDRFP